MCFSATGSFAVAAGLASIGVAAVLRAKPDSHRLFAVIPFLFAIQQIAEGVVWMTMPFQSSGLHRFAVDAFLTFAVVVWPTWMPLCLVPIERGPRRKATLRVLLAMGAAVSIYAGWLLFHGHPVAKVQGHSLAYDYSPSDTGLVLALYLPAYVATSVLPLFISSMERAKLMGLVLVGALVATFIIRRQTLTSTWCFFAAILSGLVVLSLAAEQRAHLKRGAAATHPPSA